MAEIYHKLTIEAPATKVKEALTSIEWLKKWWLDKTSGNPGELNGEIEFGDREMWYEKMQVSELSDNKVVWKVLEEEIKMMPDNLKWTGSEISYELEEKQLERIQGKTVTILLFKHKGLPEGSESTKQYAEMNWHWAFFLLSLKNVAEGKAGMPM